MAADPKPSSGSASTFALKALPFVLVGELDVTDRPQGFAERACNRKLRVISGDLRVWCHTFRAHLADDGVKTK